MPQRGFLESMKQNLKDEQKYHEYTVRVPLKPLTMYLVETSSFSVRKILLNILDVPICIFTHFL
jgi:hypothetical protein